MGGVSRQQGAPWGAVFLLVSCAALVGGVVGGCFGGASRRPPPARCEGDGECGGGRCAYGRCRAECVGDADCAEGSACVPIVGAAGLRVCLSPSESECQVDDDCAGADLPSVFVCRDDGTCGPACESDDECPGYQVCVGYECVEPTCNDDGLCDRWETPAECPGDCRCGNGVCDEHVETARTCEADCPADPSDGFCTHDENAETNPEECPVLCGDGACSSPEEGACSCEADCLEASCGDGCCTHDETVFGCPEDCHRVVQVAVGAANACAIVEGGTVWCWGTGAFGVPGLGSYEDVGDDETPAEAGPVDLGAPAAAVAFSHNTVCALTEAGEVRCWGSASSAVVGIESLAALGFDDVFCAHTGSLDTNCLGGTPETVPALLPPLELPAPALDLACGSAFCCAVLDDGGASCWGSNTAGRLGNGDLLVTSSAAPVPVVDLPAAVRQIAAGASHACALLETGEVFCWGDDQHGQLGDGEAVSAPGVGPISAPGALERISGVTAADERACVLATAGELWCWGRNFDWGLVPDGEERYPVPARIDLGDWPVDEVALGCGGSWAVSVGGLRRWGGDRVAESGVWGSCEDGEDNDFDALVDCYDPDCREDPACGGEPSLPPPFDLGGVAVERVAVAGASLEYCLGCLITEGGAVRCWGSGAHAPLITGTTLEVPLPTDAVDVPLF